MEFPFDVRLAVGVRMQGIVCIDREGLLKLQHQRAAALYGFGSSYAPQQHTDDRQDHVRSVVDRLGEASARAQGLKVPITSYVKMLSTDTRMYCKVEANRALGFIKVGRKKLFIRDPLGNMREMEPLCVLDFYVHESCQRSGHGKALFDHMLREESHAPAKLAYDRPSPKLINFLARHYGLRQYTQQGNNFVVYHRYFHDAPLGNSTPPASRQARRLTASGDQRHYQGAAEQPQQPSAPRPSNPFSFDGSGAASAGNPSNLHHHSRCNRDTQTSFSPSPARHIPLTTTPPPLPPQPPAVSCDGHSRKAMSHSPSSRHLPTHPDRKPHPGSSWWPGGGAGEPGGGHLWRSRLDTCPSSCSGAGGCEGDHVRGTRLNNRDGEEGRTGSRRLGTAASSYPLPSAGQVRFPRSQAPIRAYEGNSMAELIRGSGTGPVPQSPPPSSAKLSDSPSYQRHTGLRAVYPSYPASAAAEGSVESGQRGGALWPRPPAHHHATAAHASSGRYQWAGSTLSVRR
ncbi:unnamed protein product [Vitrella brassicaformis CCMP3155]|uniref:Alpha-tubulin N-acetyltransferase n=1 Tax=Vitrella brassicaformis (strain CCMP3155) TaxID=1169540 RepID=A0A0G4H430_VITBC|nr:unnamed protein product [Vitrella brassicaformis CCMP3155]|eukprot:CEM38491.1 unnamed protein product [Vitrella brassicaformis CCMP3155]